MNVWANARRACHGLTRRDLHRYDCSPAKILRDTACGQIPMKRLRGAPKSLSRGPARYAAAAAVPRLTTLESLLGILLMLTILK